MGASPARIVTDALGLTEVTGNIFQDSRTGKNGWHGKTGQSPSDDAATRLLYLALRNAAKKWTMPSRAWKQALNQFAILFQDRFPSSIY